MMGAHVCRAVNLQVVNEDGNTSLRNPHTHVILLLAAKPLEVL